MPIYNADNYLRPAIDSVLDQTLRELELICVDDGSTDHSLDIIKEFQKRDARVRIITENNAGPSAARNKGLARSRGEYIVFFDADDFSEPTMLERLYELSERESLDIAVAGYNIFNNRKATFEENIPAEYAGIFEGGAVVSKNNHPDHILQCTTAYVWNKMFRHAFLTEKELTFDNDLRVFEDTYFIVTALSLADRVGKVDEVLIHHRVYPAQSKNKLFRKYYGQVPVLYAKIKEFLRGHGMLAPLSQAYLNLSASRCYKIYNVLWSDAKEEFWNMFHEEYAEALGWTQASPEDFDHEEVRDFAANVIMYPHKQFARREKQGRRVRIASVAPSIKNRSNLKKIKGFFSRLFRRRRDNDIL